MFLWYNKDEKGLGYDDALDVIGIHGVGGTRGAWATGIFCTTAVNPAGFDGAIYGMLPRWENSG